MALEPETIFNEHVARHRVTQGMPELAQEPAEPVPVARIGKVAGPPVRPQEHAARHVLPPQLQRPAEHRDAQAPSQQMRRRGQTVRTGADNYGIVFHDEDLLRAKTARARLNATRAARRAKSALKSLMAFTAGSGSCQST